MNLDKGTPVVVIRGDFIGRFGYFQNPYPYPEGGAGYTIKLPNADKSITKGYQMVQLNDGDFIPVTGIRHEDSSDTPVPTEDRSTIGARYTMNQRIIVSNGKQRGRVGYIRSIEPIVGGLLFDYEVELAGDERFLYRIREEDIIPLDYRCTMVNGFDVGRYITTEFMVNVAEETYEEAIKKHVDNIIENRTMGGVSITDWILHEACSKYIERMDPSIMEAFITRIKEYVSTEKIGGKDCEKTFEEVLDQCLINAANSYMKDHIDEYMPAIKAKVEEATSRITADDFGTFIARNINFKEILKQAINDNN